eukprot:1158029-Pelagomonas_calceolata.AAC.1
MAASGLRIPCGHSSSLRAMDRTPMKNLLPICSLILGGGGGAGPPHSWWPRQQLASNKQSTYENYI